MSLAARFQQTLDSVRRLKTRRRAVHELRRSLALIVDLEALEASVATRIKEFFDPDLLVILQLDTSTSDFRPSFFSGLTSTELEGVEIAAQGKLARWFRVNETCLLVARDQGVINYLETREQELLQRLRAGICAPLLASNYLLGILILGSRRHWKPRRRDSELLLQLANQASLAFQNAILYREQSRRLDRLHRADRLAAVGELAAGVAHEIRNPLTVIRSTMQYLGQGLDDAPKRELIGELIDEVDRIDNTVSDLLSLTQAGSFKPEEVELVDLLHQTVRLVDTQARKQGVRIDEQTESSLVLWADGSQLKQLFLNLILNALQAMAEGGQIIVTANRELPATPAHEPLRAHVQIMDDGPGIPRDKLKTVFDPFFTTKSEGTGLGLAICHGIVQRHQGEIEIDSTEGEGTTVSIQLPIRTRTED